MALPALMPQGVRIVILAQAPDADGRGLNIVFTAGAGEEPQSHSPPAAFAWLDAPMNPAI
jgi:hypothetical protein